MTEEFDPLELVRFEPDSFITIADPETGAREMGLVTETGTDFVLYLDEFEPAILFPIWERLEPEPVDSVEILVQRVYGDNVEEGDLFAELIDEIQDKLTPYDDLTFMRCVIWAFDHQAFDLDVAVHAGLIATERARELETSLVPLF